MTEKARLFSNQDTVFLVHNSWDDYSCSKTQVWAVYKTFEGAQREADKQSSNYPNEQFFVSEEPLFD